MALTILIKFSGFKVHSKPNKLTLSAFPEARKPYYNVLCVFFYLSCNTDHKGNVS